ncbi:MAG TPA: helix-turn-helix domain-containing protein [Syntrophomonadaceae bacterium]|nr:helix-turn-helix domain-containing protein [Syntrophomonadaceae bacterium]
MREFENKGSHPPWSRTVSLAEMTKEVGIDFDDFIASIKDDVTIEEMSRKYDVSEPTINQLREHFFHYGISSVIGGD